MVSLRISVALAAVLLLACSDGPVVVLGDREAPRYSFDPPELIDELSVPAKTDNPTLTADMLTIFFTSERDRFPADIFFAERSDRSDRFGPVQRVDAVSGAGVETSPAVSADGLTLWFASDRVGGEGDLDIWVASRATRSAKWSAPIDLTVLNSDVKEIPRPVGQRARVMPMASDRDEPGYYQIFFAERRDTSSPFDAPARLPELSVANKSTVDGFLSDDGLTLFFVRGPAIGAADLYVVSRRSTSAPFEQEAALDELNTPSDERDPWLSPDGRELYFSSDRSGHYDIYVAQVHREAASKALSSGSDR